MMSDQAADEGDGAASSSPGASGETQVDEDGDGHVTWLGELSLWSITERRSTKCEGLD